MELGVSVVDQTFLHFANNFLLHFLAKFFIPGVILGKNIMFFTRNSFTILFRRLLAYYCDN